MSRTDNQGLFKTIVDVFPSPVFVVDREVTILAHNAAASRMLELGADHTPQQRAGALLHCLHATETPGGCGTAPACRECVVRNSVGNSFEGQKIVRQRTKMELPGSDGRTKERYLMVTTSFFLYAGQNLVLLVLEDISELLKAMLPICSHCKKIRNEAEHWRPLESYFLEHHNILFSHGICPECLEKYYPDIYQDIGK